MYPQEPSIASKNEQLSILLPTLPTQCILHFHAPKVPLSLILLPLVILAFPALHTRQHGLLTPLLRLLAVFEVVLPNTELLLDIRPICRFERIDVRIVWRLALSGSREERVELLARLEG